ncbi:MAG: porphobilinogen synthase [Actinomycetota bacterium]
MFPESRPRRLRRTPALRALVRETHLDPAQLILPLFVLPGAGRREPVASLPGVDRLSADLAAEAAAEAAAHGVGGVLLFGLPTEKDAEATSSWDPDGPVPSAVRAIRAAAPGLVIATDVCLCQYTDHGHCGLVGADGTILNDASLPILAKAAVAHARAGADLVAPSDMFAGRVAVIRDALDAEGLAETVGILSYSSKYASAFYGPFRDAAHSAPSAGDRRSHQLDPPNRAEAVREGLIDEQEGADLLMVKPALAYLDVIRDLSDATDLPVLAYQVSGEYAMLQHAADRGAFAFRDAYLESLVAIRRAGARATITYGAVDAAKWLA